MGYWTYLVNFMTHIYHSKGLKQWHVDEESSIEKTQKASIRNTVIFLLHLNETHSVIELTLLM